MSKVPVAGWDRFIDRKHKKKERTCFGKKKKRMCDNEHFVTDEQQIERSFYLFNLQSVFLRHFVGGQTISGYKLKCQMVEILEPK